MAFEVTYSEPANTVIIQFPPTQRNAINKEKITIRQRVELTIIFLHRIACFKAYEAANSPQIGFNILWYIPTKKVYNFCTTLNSAATDTLTDALKQIVPAFCKRLLPTCSNMNFNP